MFLRLHHRDRELAMYLKTRGLKASSPAARAARAMFDDKADMMRFFALAWPGATPEGQHHVLADGENGEVVIDCARVLRSLWEVRATRADREVAAFLVYWDDQHSTAYHGTTLLRPYGEGQLFKENQRKAQEFLDAFRGTSAADLRAVYYGESWWNNKLRVWFSACFRDGLPAGYLVEILAASRMTFGRGIGRHHNADWPSNELAAFYRAGVPAAYIARFWERRVEFDGLHEAGIPYDYAMAMEGVVV